MMSLLEVKSLSRVVGFLFSVAFQLTLVQSACKLLKTGSVNMGNNCPPFSRHDLVLAGQEKVPRGVLDLRINLVQAVKEVFWFCGEKSGTISFSKSGETYGNQLRVSFSYNVLHVLVYMCDDLSGPQRLGERCAIESISVACTGDPRTNNTCVYEIQESKYASQRITTAVTVDLSVAKKVLGAGVQIKREKSEVKETTYNRKTYIVIPGGFKFCSFSVGQTVKSPEAPTGFEWKCSLPGFYQGRVSGFCTSLSRCKKTVCASPDDFSYAGVKSTSAVCSYLLIGIAYIITYLF